MLPLRGFTLAEVLITLGIIGVVATLTIPTLISNNNKRVVETHLAKFYSTMQNAVELSEIENGPKEKWDEFITDCTPEEWFNKYLKDYIKVSKVVTDDGFLNLTFTDGSLLTWDAWAIYFYPKAKDAESGNHVRGKTQFVFHFKPKGGTNLEYHKNKGFEPYLWAWDGTETSLRNNASFGCNGINGGHYCTQLIRQNGWKIPDDYPFKF